MRVINFNYVTDTTSAQQYGMHKPYEVPYMLGEEMMVFWGVMATEIRTTEIAIKYCWQCYIFELNDPINYCHAQYIKFS